MNTPTMTPTTGSALIHSVGHDGTALFIRFNERGVPGKTYRYADAPADFMSAMLAHDSPGAYFHEHVRGKHEGVALPPRYQHP